MLAKLSLAPTVRTYPQKMKMKNEGNSPTVRSANVSWFMWKRYILVSLTGQLSQQLVLEIWDNESESRVCNRGKRQKSATMRCSSWSSHRWHAFKCFGMQMQMRNEKFVNARIILMFIYDLPIHHFYLYRLFQLYYYIIYYYTIFLLFLTLLFVRGSS